MHRSLAAILLLSLAVPRLATAAEERPTGTHCSLAAPPSDAGEDFSRGATLRIYPRAKDIDAAYVGCQTVWAPAADGWSVLAIVVIADGEPVRVWSDAPTDPRMACRYQNGRVTSGDAATCPAPRSLIARSMAPGCVAKRLDAVKEGGFGAPAPQGCEYQ